MLFILCSNMNLLILKLLNQMLFLFNFPVLTQIIACMGIIMLSDKGVGLLSILHNLSCLDGRISEQICVK